MISRSKANTVPSRARMRPRTPGTWYVRSIGRAAWARYAAPYEHSNATTRENTTRAMPAMAARSHFDRFAVWSFIGHWSLVICQLSFVRSQESGVRSQESNEVTGYRGHR